MDGLNRWTGIGNLGSDPELRVIAGGRAVMKMRVACTTSYLDNANARQERTEWLNVVVWGKRGEALAKFLAKGSRVYVEGEVRTSSYEKDGEKRYRTEVVADKVVFMNARNETERTASQVATGQESPPEHDFGDYSQNNNDEIPF